MILKHEGYIAEVGYEEGDELMHGSIVNARAVLHFAGANIDELKAAFADTIADYRDWRQERGVEPERPYSGTLSLRLSRSFTAASPNRPRGPARASINSSPIASKRWRRRT